MRIKDSPKSNVEGGNKKESKKKNSKKKTESNATVTNKNDKTSVLPKVDKEGQKRSPSKDEPEQQQVSSSASRANVCL